MLLKEVCLSLTECAGLEKHQVGFGWRQILLTGIRSFARCTQEADTHPGDELPQLGYDRHDGHENTEMERGLPGLKQHNARFRREKAGVATRKI